MCPDASSSRHRLPSHIPGCCGDASLRYTRIQAAPVRMTMVQLLFCCSVFAAHLSLAAAETKNDGTSAETDDKMPTIQRTDYRALAAHMNADRLGGALKEFAYNEMQLAQFQKLFDKPPENGSGTFEGALIEVASAVETTLAGYVAMLDRTRSIVVNDYDQHPVDMTVFRRFIECCRLKGSDLRFERQYMSLVNLSKTCDIVMPSSAKFNFYPGKNLTQHFMQNGQQQPGLRWQYLTLPSGSQIEYPAHRFHAHLSSCIQLEGGRHVRQYMAAALPYRKRVALVVEYGWSPGPVQISRVTAAAMRLLSALSSSDEVSVAVLTDRLHWAPCDGRADHAVLVQLKKFLARSVVLGYRGNVNHTAGLTDALHHLAKGQQTDKSNVHKYLFYVSRGKLSSLSESGEVLGALAETSHKLKVEVQINTVAVIDDGKKPLWETQFLADVAQQNFAKYRKNMPANISSIIDDLHSPVGKMVVVDGDENAALTVSVLYDLLKKPEAKLNPAFRKVTVIDGPWNEASAGLDFSAAALFTASPSAGRVRRLSLGAKAARSDRLIQLATPVWHSNDHFVGVTGADVSLDELTVPLKYAKVAKQAGVQVMLLSTQLDIEWHATATEWLRTSDSSNPLPIAVHESWSARSEKAVLAAVNGESHFGRMPIERKYLNETVKAMIYWRKIANTSLIVGLSVLGTNSVQPTAKFHRTTKRDSIREQCTYHRLDLRVDRSVQNYCLNVDQLSTMDKGGVYLSPGCFHRPLWHTVHAVRKRVVEAAYWAYLTDTNRLIHNTGLKGHVKDTVASLCANVHHWKLAEMAAKRKPSVIRRMACSPDGVLLTYPAQLLHTDFDPTDADWYTRAWANPSTLIFGRPFLDTAGAGYVTTVSQAVGATAASNAGAVLAVDVPLSALYARMIAALPVCSKWFTRCLLFDEHGYVLARGDPMLQANDSTATEADRPHSPIPLDAVNLSEPPEGQHVTHLEPTLAVTLLQHRLMFAKRLCATPGGGMMQRYYGFNGSNPESLTVTGRSPSGCVRVRVVGVPGTNAHLAMVDYRCSEAPGEVKSAFCPCSVTDRRCLLCARSDPAECECPCECPLGQRYMTGCVNVTESAPAPSFESCGSVDWPASPQPSLSSPAVALDTMLALSAAGDRNRDKRRTDGGDAKVDILSVVDSRKPLPQCRQVDCHALATPKECIGVVGCEWCLRTEDGRARLPRAFCSPLSRCFGAVRARLLVRDCPQDEALHMGTPVGPVAGAIMAAFVVMVIGVYCYRHQVARIMNQQRSASGQHLRLSAVDEQFFEEIYDCSEDDPKGDLGRTKGMLIDSRLMEAAGGASTDAGDQSEAAGLASFERARPARMLHPWRPGPRTESSDHGYSTMTDRACEDSERGTAIEPLTPMGPAPQCGAVAVPKLVPSAMVAGPSVVVFDARTAAVNRAPASARRPLVGALHRTAAGRLMAPCNASGESGCGGGVDSSSSASGWHSDDGASSDASLSTAAAGKLSVRPNQSTLTEHTLLADDNDLQTTVRENDANGDGPPLGQTTLCSVERADVVPEVQGGNNTVTVTVVVHSADEP